MRAVKSSLISVFDQVFCSAANFLAFTLVARNEPVSAAGEYAVMFSCLTFTLGIQNSLVIGPMRVLGARFGRFGDEGYFTQAFQLQVFVGLMLAVLSAIPVFLSLGFAWALTFGLACVAQQLQQFERAEGQTIQRPMHTLASDCITHSVRLAMLIALKHAGLLEPMTAFLALTAGSIMASLIMRRNRALLNLPTLSKVSAAHWGQGKWMLAETMSFYVSTQFYILMVSGILGLQEAGRLALVQNVMNVVNVLTIGIAAVAPSVIRRELLENGYANWRKVAVAHVISVTLIAVTMVIILAVAHEPIFKFLYGRAVTPERDLIILIGLVSILSALNALTAVAFRTIDRADLGGRAKFLTAILTLAVGPMLLKEYGMQGAVLGLVATQLTWSMVYALYCFRGAADREVVEALRARVLNDS